jgi:ribosomal protein S27AE
MGKLWYRIQMAWMVLRGGVCKNCGDDAIVLNLYDNYIRCDFCGYIRK